MCIVIEQDSKEKKKERERKANGDCKQNGLVTFKLLTGESVMVVVGPE